MKRVPAKTPRPWKEARGIKFQPTPAKPPRPSTATPPQRDASGSADEASR